VTGPRWIDQPMSAFDVESTGKDPDDARIVTATLVTIEPGTEPVVKAWLADPGVDIPDEAAGIHGITTEHARQFGRPAREVIDEVRLALADAWFTGPVIAYNASYDLTVVTREVARHHKTPFEVAGPVIDPYIIDKALDRWRKGSRKLTEVCAHYGVRLDGAHNATEDALAAARVAWKQARIYPTQVGHVTPAELHEMTAGWFTEQQLRFADHLTQKIAPGITDQAERADVLARAEAIRADSKGWPVRGAA
jgi:DNA polymerase-3 subunit epsilon